jgi:ribosomal protein L6P/L9E
MVVGVTEGFTKSLELVELVIELLIKDKIRFSSWIIANIVLTLLP